MEKFELITVDSPSDYPGCFSKKENEIIKMNIIGKSLHLFSGNSLIGDIRIDYSNINATNHMDVFEFIENFVGINEYNTFIIDFPYNEKFGNKYQKIGNTSEQFIGFAQTKKTTLLFDTIIELNPKTVIMKSWNYYCIKGYKIEKCYICYPGGYRKSTFLEIMKKIN